MNYHELSVTLDGELAKHKISISRLCRSLDRSRPTVLNKLNNPETLTLGEMEMLRDLLGLDMEICFWR